VPEPIRRPEDAAGGTGAADGRKENRPMSKARRLKMDRRTVKKHVGRWIRMREEKAGDPP